MQKTRKIELTRLEIPRVRDFDPMHTFECGQCFRWWKEENGSYSGIVGDIFANIDFEKIQMTGQTSGRGNIVIYGDDRWETDSIKELFWRDYLDLDTDYDQIKRTLGMGDPIMRRAISTGQGIRILHQDKWEALISFIISQNNNIPRIKSCIEELCREFGNPLGTFYGRELYGFPSIETLASLKEHELYHVKLGYRAKYIIETAKQVAYDSGVLLNSGDYIDDVKIEEYLTSLSGVGPKVAHCIMLFSMKKKKAFPIDVWVKRVMNMLYGIEEDDIRAMKKYAKDHFGEFGGMAQQYLFYFIRELKTVEI